MRRMIKELTWAKTRWALIALATGLAPALVTPDADACGGTPQPVCGKSTILAKPSPRTIVVRPNQTSVTMRVTVAVQATGGNCPTPVST